MKKNQTLPGFSKLLGGRRKKSASELLEERIHDLRSGCVSQLESLFEEQITPGVFDGVDQRRRQYPSRTVFWSFISQVMNAEDSFSLARGTMKIGWILIICI